MVWSEARIVRQRHASRQKTDKALLQSVMASILSDKAGKALMKTMQGMTEID